MLQADAKDMVGGHHKYGTIGKTFSKTIPKKKNTVIGYILVKEGTL